VASRRASSNATPKKSKKVLNRCKTPPFSIVVTVVEEAVAAVEVAVTAIEVAVGRRRGGSDRHRGGSGSPSRWQ
jgi:hypothetical protein